MRLILSSKTLSKALSEFDFNNESINMAELSLGENHKLKNLRLYGNVKGVVELRDIETFEESQCLNQTDVRWDFIFDTLSKIQEQPIVLEIWQNRVNINLQY